MDVGPRNLLVALSNPLPNRSDELSDWYCSRHIPDVLDVAGMESCRFARFDPITDRPVRWEYAALYEMGAEPAVAVSGLMARIGTEAMPVSNALDRSAGLLFQASSICEKRFAKDSSDGPGTTTSPFIVLTNPIPGREEEFNSWYTDRHLADVLRVPGFVSAQRFKVSAVREDAALPWAYLAIYEVEFEKLASALQELRARAGTPQVALSDALSDDVFSALYSEL